MPQLFLPHVVCRTLSAARCLPQTRPDLAVDVCDGVPQPRLGHQRDGLPRVEERVVPAQWSRANDTSYVACPRHVASGTRLLVDMVNSLVDAV
jgi:hypothetical protein